MANEFPASRSDTPLQQVPAAPYPCGPVAWVSLDARGRASSARTREGVQPAHASGEVRISAPTEPLPWRRSTAILAKPTDHGSQTAKSGLGQYQYVAAEDSRASFSVRCRAEKSRAGQPRVTSWRHASALEGKPRNMVRPGTVPSCFHPWLPFFFLRSELVLFCHVQAPPLPLPPRYAPQNGPPRQISAIWS